MKRSITLLCFVAAVLLWSACGRAELQGEAEYGLYFLTAANQLHGPALTAQPWPFEEGKVPDPGDLLEALEAGPTQEGLQSPFPRGVTVRGWEWDPEVPGKLRVQMSEAYSGLTDIALTLADYSIVLTLAQLDGVESVEIQTSAYLSNYRSHPVLVPEEAVLSDTFTN